MTCVWSGMEVLSRSQSVSQPVSGVKCSVSGTAGFDYDGARHLTLSVADLTPDPEFLSAIVVKLEVNQRKRPILDGTAFKVGT